MGRVKKTEVKLLHLKRKAADEAAEEERGEREKEEEKMIDIESLEEDDKVEKNIILEILRRKNQKSEAKLAKKLKDRKSVV